MVLGAIFAPSRCCGRLVLGFDPTNADTSKKASSRGSEVFTDQGKSTCSLLPRRFVSIRLQQTGLRRRSLARGGRHLRERMFLRQDALSYLLTEVTASTKSDAIANSLGEHRYGQGAI